MTTVTRTYLELRSPDDFRPAPLGTPSLRLTRECPCPVALYRTLYDLVGRAYRWVDRNAWSDVDLRAYLARPEVSVWVLRDGPVLAGYFELLRHDDTSIEIAYFGLAPDHVGHGVGKWLLTRAVEEAWAFRPSRVWLHTCTLDHPSALRNYLARGFTSFRTETLELVP